MFADNFKIWIREGLSASWGLEYNTINLGEGG